MFVCNLWCNIHTLHTKSIFHTKIIHFIHRLISAKIATEGIICGEGV